MVRLVGVEESVKFCWAAGWTASVIVVVCESLSLVAVTTGCVVPVGVLDAVLTVSVAELRLGGITFELVPSLSFQLPVAPLGRPDTLSVTAPANPLVRVTATEYAVDCPCVTVWLEGEAAIEKSAFPPAAKTARVPKLKTARTPSNIKPNFSLALFAALFRSVLI